MELDLLLSEYLKLLDKPFAKYLTELLNTIINEKNNNKKSIDYTFEWWNDYVIPNVSKEEKNRIIKKNIKTLEELGITANLRVFRTEFHAIKKLCKSLNSSLLKVFTKKKFDTVRNMVDLRNDLSHQDTSEGKYSLYLDTLHTFAIMIKAPRQIIQKIDREKVDLYFSSSKETDEIKKNQLIKILNDLVLNPAYNHPKATPLIKEKVEHSWKYLKDCKTSRDVEDFYWNAQTKNKSGAIAYQAIKSIEGLNTFEDIRVQFMDVLGY